jgi:hypothetical protein
MLYVARLLAIIIVYTHFNLTLSILLYDFFFILFVSSPPFAFKMLCVRFNPNVKYLHKRKIVESQSALERYKF